MIFSKEEINAILKLKLPQLSQEDVDSFFSITTYLKKDGSVLPIDTKVNLKTAEYYTTKRNNV